MAKTVVGLMESSREAERVARDLMDSCGCDRGDIGLVAGKQGADAQRGDDVASGGALTKAGIPEHEARYYEEGLQRGGTLLTIHARTDEMARCAASVMERGGQAAHERAAPSARAQPDTGAGAGEKKTMPLVEEELVVGKREVSRGRVRIYTHVIEQPARETVELREEHVSVERRPVDRPVHPADQAFKEQTIEIRETAEEAVVTKRARVVEEVVVRKEETTRVETIQENVRKTDVRVERIGEQKGRGPAYPGAERRKDQLAYNGQDRRRHAIA